MTAATIKSLTLFATEYVVEIVAADGSVRTIHLPIGLSPANDSRLAAMATFVRDGGELEVAP